jgi:hypothetical protein
MKTIAFLSALFCASQLWAVSFDSDIPKDIQKQFNEDLALANQVKASGKTPFHQEIFGDVSGANYKKFFEDRITSVGMDACGGGGGVAACVQPFFDPNKMWLTPNFIKASMPQIARVMIIYHEARHTESQHGNWGHDNCPTPFLDEQGHDIVGLISGMKLEGMPACDSTYLGSYGSSTVMIKNIAKFCSNCSDKVKMDAELWASDQLNRIDKPSVKKAMIADFATH